MPGAGEPLSRSGAQEDRDAAPRQDVSILPDETASVDLARLKGLLFASEQERLARLQGRLEAIDQRVGDDRSLEQTTSHVLAGALRLAESQQHRELAQAIAPLVVAAIRSEIKNSKDMMVEALYPITGRLVAAAVANAFRELAEAINQRLDALLSTRQWQWRLQSLMSGRPLNEIALAAAHGAIVERILVLERGSGLLLASWSRRPVAQDKSDLVSSMIAAITEFATDALSSQHGELRTLDMGASRVLLRASARRIVAAEFLGEVSREDEQKLDLAFMDMVDRDAVASEASLAALAQEIGAPAPSPKNGKTRAIVAVGAAVGLLALLAIGPVTAWRHDRLALHAFETAVQAQPDLSAYPLRLVIDRAANSARVSGLAPANADLDALVRAVQASGATYAVSAQVDLLASQKQAGALADSLAQSAEAQSRNLQRANAEIAALRGELAAALAQNASPRAKLELVVRATAIFFKNDTDFSDPEKAAAQIQAIGDSLKQTDGSIRIVGYADGSGSDGANQALSRRRAAHVGVLLEAQGIPAARLILVGRAASDPIADAIGAERGRNRRVVFEIPYQGEREP